MTRHGRIYGSGSFFLPLALVAAVLVAGCGDAESRPDTEGDPVDRSEAPAPDNGADEASPDAPLLALPAGTRLTFEVAEEVSTGSHEAGDTFALRLVEGVDGTNGLRIDRGSTARGAVTVATPSPDAEQEAVLAFQVESLRVDDRNRALNGVVEDADTESASRDSGARTAAKVATGAAAGAIIGQVIGGNTRSTTQGAAAGAVAGLGVALTTRDGHAVLPEGSIVTVRLEDAFVVN